MNALMLSGQPHQLERVKESEIVYQERSSRYIMRQ